METFENRDLAVHQMDRKILNANAPDNRASQYIKQKLIELSGKIGKLAVIAKDFNILLSIIGRVSIQKPVRI